MHKKSAVRDVDYLDTLNTLYSVDDCLFMFTGDCIDGNVANNVVAAHTNNIDSPNVAPRLANRGGNFAERAGTSRKLYAQR